MTRSHKVAKNDSSPHVSGANRRPRLPFILAVAGFVLYPLLLLSIFILFFSWIMGETVKGPEYPQEAVGIVTSVASDEGWGTYEPCSLDFSFSTDEGEFTGYAVKSSEASCKYEPGDEIAITYDPTNPRTSSNFEPGFLENHGGPFIIATLIFAHLVLAGGIWAMVIWNRSGRRPI